MGFKDEIVGVSFFCNLNLPKVADVKINWEGVLKLKPTFVFMLSSQETKKGIQILKKLNINYGIYSFDSLKSIPFCAQDISRKLGRNENGKKHFNNFMSLVKNLPKIKKQSAIYVLWWKPLIVSTNLNYISETLNLMGFKIYPEDNIKDFKKFNIENIFIIKPDIIFVADDAGKPPDLIKKNFKIFYLPSKIVNRPNLTFLKHFYSFKNENIFN